MEQNIASVEDRRKRAPYLTGISLTEIERDIVIKESERLGLNNFSATLRLIIREWYDRRQDM